MNNKVLEKFQNGYKRLTNAANLIFFPRKFYLYPKKTYEYHKFSYSQQGEDMVLASIFARGKTGFYVDIGAFHPQKYSNTYYFYLQGWRGINIDAHPGSMILFNRIRPNDINLEVGISNENKSLNYYLFDEPALNGFSLELSIQREEENVGKIIKTQEIEVFKLSEILDNFLPKETPIDFFSIDVEGLDYEVLRSNNWEKYRPKLILIETLDGLSIETYIESQSSIFLKEYGYSLYCKTLSNLIFKLNDFDPYKYQ